MSLRLVAASSIAALLLPYVAHAQPFGGAINTLFRCYNVAIFANVGPPRPAAVVWTPATRTYRFGAPRAVGQWLLGLVGAPHYCVVSIFPVIVFPGKHIAMMGSSGAPAQISLNTALTQGTPAPGLPPHPPDAVCPGSPGTTSCPGSGHMMIGEVFGIVDSSHGVDPTNEWVELYNGSGAIVNLSGWRLVWGGATTTLPTASIAAGEIVIFSPATTTRTHWNVPTNVEVVALSGTGNMAENGAVRLIDPTGVVIDAMSWGTDTSAFSPAAPAMRVGHSLVRTTILTDNNVASDWSDRAEPSPGN